MSTLMREAIADLVLENAALRQRLAFYESLLGKGSEMLYHCKLAGLPAHDRGYSLDEDPGAEAVVELADTSDGRWLRPA
jgi:hypothetical protein